MDESQDIARLEPGSEEFEARFSEVYRHAQVGRCVHVVAHDFNNVLGTILAYAELASLDGNAAPETKRMLGEVVNGINRCSALVNQFSEIARSGGERDQMVDPRQLVENVLSLRSHYFRSRRVRVESELAENLPSAVGDQASLTQAVLYLIYNAEEAVESIEDKRIRVRLDAGDDGFRVMVWNAGPPPDGAALDWIFEPFTTTKNVCHLGYGLTAARAIALAHGGGLDYDPASGFVFRVPWDARKAPRA